MTFAEELRRKYALTSLRAKGSSLVLHAIHEALEVAAKIADHEASHLAASRIRSLKWLDRSTAPPWIDKVHSLSPNRHGLSDQSPKAFR
jgi:hypothetical protein